VARHRSPQGRRAHLEPPLSAHAAAGVGDAHRPHPVSQATVSLPVRFVATAVAGGALAAVGQQALVANLPDTADGGNVLRLGVQEFLGATAEASGDTALVTTAAVADTAATTTSTTRPLVTLAPVPAASSGLSAGSEVVDARDLVKAADMQRQAVENGASATTPKRKSAAERAADAIKVGSVAEGAQRAAGAGTAKADEGRSAGSDRAAAKDAAAKDAAPKDAAAKDAAAKDAAAKDGAAGDKVEAGRTAGKKPKADTSSLSGGAIQMVAGRVTSGFGARWGTRHEGLDIAAPIGTPIRAPMPGTVVDSGPASGFGLWVRVRHGDGTVTTYGHVNRSFVTTGEQVSAGQEIAEVGNRGHSTGPHLHIEVTTPGGTKINPRPWLDQHGIGY
jgi:murein DD-endopeptidase MepM/ murein hydrolase activator NlpD